MDDPQFPLPQPASAGNPDLTLESLLVAHNALRTSLHVTLVMFLILSGSLFVFFLREVSLARRQINELRQVVVDYEKNTFPAMESFRGKLQAFTQTHPDFGAIYAKYFGGNNLSPAGQAAGKGLSSSNAPRLPSMGDR
jgi:hypothetical protein